MTLKIYTLLFFRHSHQKIYYYYLPFFYNPFGRYLTILKSQWTLYRVCIYLINTRNATAWYFPLVYWKNKEKQIVGRMNKSSLVHGTALRTRYRLHGRQNTWTNITLHACVKTWWNAVKITSIIFSIFINTHNKKYIKVHDKIPHNMQKTISWMLRR